MLTILGQMIQYFNKSLEKEWVESDIKVNLHKSELDAADKTAQSTLSVGVGVRSLE